MGHRGDIRGEEAMERSGAIIDFLLNEGSAEDRASVRDQLDLDPEFAVDCAEFGDLFETMRSLDPEPRAPDRMRLAIRYAIQRRQLLRASGSVFGDNSFRDVFWAGLCTACVTAASLAVMVGTGWLYHILDGEGPAAVPPTLIANATELGPMLGQDGGDFELRALLAGTDAVIEAADPSLRRAYTALHFATRAMSPAAEQSAGAGQRSAAGARRGTLARHLEAENLLARLREEVSLRESDVMRRRVSRAVGGPDLEYRIQMLASTVEQRVRAELAVGEAEGLVWATSAALRALLAAGSTRDTGPHAATVEACFRVLRDRVGSLDGGALAVALAGLTEYAVVHGGAAGELVGRESGRLARNTIGTHVPARPALLHWRTPGAILAEAGRVFRLAPAFGTHPDLASKARQFIAAHLAERLNVGVGVDRPSLCAAQLYGFGDLIDRDAIEHRMLLWRATLLIPDYQALHHLAWSKFPVRPGWAQFQSELRGLGAEPTPAGTADAAALLLCLSMNFAAPGALDVVLLARL